MDRTGLESLLVEARDSVVFPETPDVVDAVLRRLGEDRSTPVMRRRWLEVAAVAAVIVAVALALPAPRRALAGLFGLGGVEVTFVSELPQVATASEPPGDVVSLERARDEVGFEILLPQGYGEPESVHLDATIPGGLITMTFQAGPDGYGLVITEMLGSVHVPILRKVVGPDVTVAPVDVGGDEGYWIEGQPHQLAVLDTQRRDRVDLPRLVGNTLLFVRDGTTIRIESGAGLPAALDVAAALR